MVKYRGRWARQKGPWAHGASVSKRRDADMVAALSRPAPGARSALWMSTFAFTACFAVWTIFSIIGIQIKTNLGLNETQFGLLVGTPILTGSLVRVLLGMWADQYGGRIVNRVVMLLAAVATYLLSFAER